MFKKVFNEILNKKKNLPKEVLEDKTLGKYKIVKTHKNNTQLIYFPKNKIFKKFSRSTNGILKIEAEYQGLRWYCKRNCSRGRSARRVWSNTNHLGIDV